MRYHVTYPSGRKFTVDGDFGIRKVRDVSPLARHGMAYTSTLPVPTILLDGPERILKALDPRAVIVDALGAPVFTGCTTDELVRQNPDVFLMGYFQNPKETTPTPTAHVYHCTCGACIKT
jgi:hypothetical protein